ncbi:hypothetical protein D3C87_1304710 [compost metagenome]
MTIRSIGFFLAFTTAATFSVSALAAKAKLTCVETESHESRTSREYNGDDGEGVLKNAKPNKSGNIGDYTITFDSRTKQIISVEAVRKTSGIKQVFNQKNSKIRNKLVALEPGSFDGDCSTCRTHYELIEAVSNNSADRVVIQIDDHGLYPDFVGSNLSLRKGSVNFNLADEVTTELNCDSTILLKRPDPSTSVESELLE